MRVDPRFESAAAVRQAVLAPPAAPVPAAAGDRVAPQDGGPADAADALGTWAKNEWTTVAGAAHGLAATPGIVSHALIAAARTNDRLAHGLRDAVDGWDGRSPAVRETGIAELVRAAGPNARGISALTTELFAANRAGALPAGVADRTRSAAAILETAAAGQSEQASHWLAGASRFVGMTGADVDAKLTGIDRAESVLSRVPLLSKMPLAAAALTGAAIAGDVAGGTSRPVAIAANVGGTIAGTVAGDAATAALEAIMGTALVDSEAAALGLAVATGPAGVAVAGGVIAGAAVSYGVEKAVESGFGQRAIASLFGQSR